jgi:hypothetical protein
MQTKYLQPKKLAVFITLLSIPLLGHADDANNLANAPMYIASDEGSPNIMLTLGKEHTIFNAAYNDYVDLNEDGIIDLMFDPSIQYEGNFDYTLCYKYQSDMTGLKNVNENDADFRCNLELDNEVKLYLSHEDLDDCFNQEVYLKNIDAIFKKFCLGK